MKTQQRESCFCTSSGTRLRNEIECAGPFWRFRGVSVPAWILEPEAQNRVKQAKNRKIAPFLVQSVNYTKATGYREMPQKSFFFAHVFLLLF
jgi:hypothetical protein